MDFLLRDSYHCGVKYGSFDLERLVAESCLCEMPEEEGHQVGVTEDARHAAESLLIARHMMYSQVYLHKTRTILDYHLIQCIKHILADKKYYPSKDSLAELREYILWDDWTIHSKIKEGMGGDHGKIIFDRNHFRLVYEVDLPSPTNEKELIPIREGLAKLPIVERWVEEKGFGGDIPIRMHPSSGSGYRPLSKISSVPQFLRGFNRVRFYAPLNIRDSADSACKSFFPPINREEQR